MIGFAFLVPDVKFNEAYISFIFTHPEWRGAGIATFMLYHLIQVRRPVQLGLLHTVCIHQLSNGTVRTLAGSPPWGQKASLLSKVFEL